MYELSIRTTFSFLNHLTSLDVFVYIDRMWYGQIHANMSTSMQYQVRHLYNTTGSQSVNTSSVTYRVTVAWDQLQRQVRSGYYYDQLTIGVTSR